MAKDNDPAGHRKDEAHSPKDPAHHTAPPLLQATQRPCAVESVLLGFPVFAIAFCPTSLALYVAGGGGPAKSGVRNCLVWRATQQTLPSPALLTSPPSGNALAPTPL